jgi:hypothetical protein
LDYRVERVHRQKQQTKNPHQRLDDLYRKIVATEQAAGRREEDSAGE